MIDAEAKPTKKDISSWELTHPLEGEDDLMIVSFAVVEYVDMLVIFSSLENIQSIAVCLAQRGGPTYTWNKGGTDIESGLHLKKMS